MSDRPAATGAGARRSPARRALRWSGAVLGTLAALVVAAVIVAPLVVRGARFGRLVERALPPLRGQIHVGGGHGSWRTLLGLALGRSGPIAVDDVVIVDPEGVEVLRIGRIWGDIEIHRDELWRITVRNVHVDDAAWRFATMKNDRRVGLALALQPKVAPSEGPRPPRAAPKTGATGAELVIVDAALEHVTTTFDLRDWGLVLKDGSGAGSLYVRATKGAPPVFRFEVRGADILGGGKLRVLGGRWSFVLPFSRGRLDRVATTAADPDDLRLEASGVETGTSTLALGATFRGIYGFSPASRHPGMALDGGVENAADAVGAMAQSEGWSALPPLGPGARVALHFEGPFTGPSGSVSVQSATLGRFEASGAFEARAITGALDFQGFQLGRVLPQPLVPFAGGRLDGHLRGHFDLDGPSTLDDMALALTRPPQTIPNLLRVRAGSGHFDGPKTPGAWELDLTEVGYRKGRIHIPELSVPVYAPTELGSAERSHRGRAREPSQGSRQIAGRISASGEVALRDPTGKMWLPAPEIDLRLGADGFALDRLLGTKFVEGSPIMRARVRGPLARLRAQVTVPRRGVVGIVGQRFVLPARFEVLVADETLSFQRVRLTGPEASALEASGRVTFAGRVGMRVHLDAFPLSRIPGLAATHLPVNGRISGDLQFAGGPELPRINGQLAFAAVSFQGRTLGDGSVVITEGPNGGIRGHGKIISGVEASGELEPGQAGLSGGASIELDKLALDPFLPLLPGRVRGTGRVSGRLSVRLSPGRPPQAEGDLRELSLLLTPPPRNGKSIPAFELHAERDIHLSAQAGGGPVTIGPARFGGDGGSIELYGESRGDKLQATVRGRIELGALAPLLSPWLARVSGSVDVNLVARPGRRARRRQRDRAGRGGRTDWVSVGLDARRRPRLVRASQPRWSRRGDAWIRGGLAGVPLGGRGGARLRSILPRRRARERVFGRAGGPRPHRHRSDVGDGACPRRPSPRQRGRSRGDREPGGRGRGHRRRSARPRRGARDQQLRGTRGRRHLRAADCRRSGTSPGAGR